MLMSTGSVTSDNSSSLSSVASSQSSTSEYIPTRKIRSKISTRQSRVQDAISNESRKPIKYNKVNSSGDSACRDYRPTTASKRQKVGGALQPHSSPMPAYMVSPPGGVRKSEQPIQQQKHRNGDVQSLSGKTSESEILDASATGKRTPTPLNDDFPVNPKNPVIYGANCKPKERTTSNGSPSATSSPARRPRGGGAGRGRGGAGNGRGGKGRPRGGGRSGRAGDSPERRRALGPEAKALIASLKTRQQELKKFFSTVGTYQADLLEMMASRDLNKLIRKSKAHKQVPDYDETIEDLGEKRDEANELARKKYEVALEAEMQLFEAEKQVIENRFKITVQEAHKEHLRGAEGEINLLNNAHASFEDDARTETGSIAEDNDRLPRFNTSHEPHTRMRGYFSSKVRDETPFKQLSFTNTTATNSHADQARRDVIDIEVLSPIKTAFVEKARAERALEAHNRSKNMAALSRVAEQELQEELQKIPGYLVPRRLQEQELSSFALSALADVSEWAARAHANDMYKYIPLPPGESFPRSALEFGPPPGVGRPLAPAQPPPLPPPPQRQFIFQQPAGVRGFPGSAGAGQPAPPAQRIPVTFVNSTIGPSRKASGGKGAAAGAVGGSTGQRMLLPKGYAPR